MKVLHFILFLFVLGIDAQRRSSNSDASDPSTSPRTRGRGRVKFNPPSGGGVEDLELTTRSISRRKEGPRKVESQTQVRNIERRPSRPVQQPLESRPYEVREEVDDVPRKASRKSLKTKPSVENINEASSTSTSISSSTETLAVEDINKLSSEELVDFKDEITREDSIPKEPTLDTKNEILPSKKPNESGGADETLSTAIRSENSAPFKSESLPADPQNVPRRKVSRKKIRVNISEPELRQSAENTLRRKISEEQSAFARHVVEPSQKFPNNIEVSANAALESLPLEQLATKSQIEDRNAPQIANNVPISKSSSPRTSQLRQPSVETEASSESVRIPSQAKRIPIEKERSNQLAGRNDFVPSRGAQESRSLKDETLFRIPPERYRSNIEIEAVPPSRTITESRRGGQLKVNNVRSRGNSKQLRKEDITTESVRARSRVRTSQKQLESTTSRGRTRERGRGRIDLETAAGTTKTLADNSHVLRARTGRRISDTTSKVTPANEKKRSSRRSPEPQQQNVDKKADISIDQPEKANNPDEDIIKKEEKNVSSDDIKKTATEKDESEVLYNSVRTSDIPLKENSRPSPLKNRRQDSDRHNNENKPSTARSRSRFSLSNLEVLPLFESESKPIPTRASASVSPNTISRRTSNSVVQSTEASLQDVKRRRSGEKRLDAATTVRSRVTRRQVAKDSTEEITSTGSGGSISRRRGSQPTVKKSVQVSEVTQITSSRKIGRRRKNIRKITKPENTSDENFKSTTEKQVTKQGVKPTKERKSEEKRKSGLSRSEEDSNESDNYPEPFKSLIKAKKPDFEKDPKPRTTEQAKVTEKLQIVTPFTTPVTSSATPSASLSSGPVEHVYFRKDEDKENELEPSKNVPAATRSKSTAKKPLKQGNAELVTEKPKKLSETAIKKSNNFSSTTEAPKSRSKVLTSQRKKGRYHARFKSTTNNPNENEILSTTKVNTLKARNFSPRPTGLYSSKKTERSTIRPNILRGTPKTYSKTNKTYKDSKTQTPVAHKSTVHRFSSRYRSDISKRNGKFHSSTPGPKYIPTVPSVKTTPITEWSNYDVIDYQWSSNRIV